MTAECDKMGVNFGPPDAPSQAGLSQDPSLEYHGGCPLAEIWVTSIARGGVRRQLHELQDGSQTPTLSELVKRRGGQLREGDMFVMDHAGSTTPGSAVGEAIRRRLRTNDSIVGLSDELEAIAGADIAVASAFSYHRVSRNFRFTNGERPFFAGPNGEHAD